MTTTFPDRHRGTLYLTEGGIETELMYRHGLDLPHLAAFPLLDGRAGRKAVRRIYRRAAAVARENGFTPLLGGLDHRASPDWGAKLGYSAAALADATLAAVEFPQQVLAAEGLSGPRVGTVGPRGGASGTGARHDAAAFEDYHAVQIGTLARGRVDLVVAMTVGTVAEAVGIARAARAAGLPLAISFTVGSEGRLPSGAGLREAVEGVDRLTDRAPAFYMIDRAHPVEFEPGIAPGDWIARVRGLRPSATRRERIASGMSGRLEEGDWREVGHLMTWLAARFPHMDIWGASTGADHKHLEEIARGVASVHRLPKAA